MSNQPRFTHPSRHPSTHRFTSLDYSRIADEVRQGGIHAVPAFLASRWGLSEGDARTLINKYQTH